VLLLLRLRCLVTFTTFSCYLHLEAARKLGFIRHRGINGMKRGNTTHDGPVLLYGLPSSLVDHAALILCNTRFKMDYSTDYPATGNHDEMFD
jgi:hypothetical protein